MKTMITAFQTEEREEAKTTIPFSIITEEMIDVHRRQAP